jgi:hypothetical protein
MHEKTWLRWFRDGIGGRDHLPLVRLLVVASVALGMAGAGSLVGGAQLAYAAAATCPSGWTTTVSGTTITCSHTFSPTGQEQSFTVPTRVDALSFTATGGNGDYYNFVDHGSGGDGAEVDATIPVSALPSGTTTLYVEVGGAGSGAAGGWNGGGNGNTILNVSGGAGGGASDVRTSSCGTSCGTSTDTTLGTRLLVAGGGGGAGDGGTATAADCPATAGNGGSSPASDGAGGYTLDGASGGSGGPDCWGDTGGGGGGGATTSGGGSAGSGGSSSEVFAGSAGGSGVSGIGGAGSAHYYGGGGGGGGYYGGGGGGGSGLSSNGYYGGSGGGGGGSSYVTSSATSSSVGPGAGSPSVTVSYVLPVKATTITLASSANPTIVGQTVTFTATVSPAPDGGLVSFSQNGASISCGGGSQPLNNGTAACVVTYTGGGTYSIAASYSGDDNFAPSSVASALAQQVNLYSPTLTTTASPSSTVFGATLSDSATLSGGDNPGGTITFSLWAPGVTPGCRRGQGCAYPVYSDVVTANGDGVYSTVTGSNPGGYVANALGTYQWVASYSGDANNYSTWTDFGAEPVTVGKASATTSLAVTSPAQPSGLPAGIAVSVAGQSVTFTASVTVQAPGSGAPTGTVTFTDGSTTLCSAAPVTSGTSTCSATFTGVGQHSISASYSGDANYAPSGPATLTLYVDTNISQYLHNGVYNLSNVNLSGGYFVGVNLSGANLSDGNFSNANFTAANLSGANLSNGNFSGTAFAGANLSGANFTQTNLIGATGLTSATLTGVIWNKTTCPDNTLSSKDGGTCVGHL